MPRLYVSPTMSADVSAAVRIFGNELRVEILCSLFAEPNQTVSDLARSLPAAKPTVQHALEALQADGVIVGDLDQAERRPGRPLHYSVDIAVARRLFSALRSHLPADVAHDQD